VGPNSLKRHFCENIRHQKLPEDSPSPKQRETLAPAVDQEQVHCLGNRRYDIDDGNRLIIRIIGGDAYEVDENLSNYFFDLDVCIDRSLASGEDIAFREALIELTDAIHAHGRVLNNDSHLPADIVVPHPETSLEQFRIQMDSEAFED